MSEQLLQTLQQHSETLQKIAKSLANDVVQKQQILDASRVVDKDAALIKRYIETNSNPAPVYIVAIVLIIVFVAFVAHRLLLTPSMCGTWHSSKTAAIYNISHNALQSTITITPTGDGGGNSDKCETVSLNGCMFVYAQKLGIWNYSNLIKFPDLEEEWIRAR